MRAVLDNPKRTYVVLVVLLVGFFALSAVGQSKGSRVAWIGDTGWTLFMITILATIVYSIIQLVRVLVRRRRTSVA
jgi:hypothetical protein